MHNTITTFDTSRRHSPQQKVKALNTRIDAMQKERGRKYVRGYKPTKFGFMSQWDEELLKMLHITTDTPENIVKNSPREVIDAIRINIKKIGQFPFARAIISAFNQTL